MRARKGMVGTMRRSRVALGLVVLVGGGAGCQLVLGMGDWVEAGSGGGGAGTTSTAGGGTGGVGGTGGATGTVCKPGEKVACYDGAAGTEGVGSCKAGLATCDEQGTALGPCEGQVKPGAEQPDVIGDEACDGYAPGEPVWWRTFGDDKDQWPDAIASDKDGNVYVCGTFEGTLKFDENASLVSQGAHDIFLVKLDKDGKAVWSKRFGNPEDQDDCHMAVDDGGVAIAGTWQGTMYFGGQLFESFAERLLVARFDGAGKHLWSRELGLSIQPFGNIATLPTGDVVLVGSVPNSNQDGGFDALLAKLAAATGDVAWSKHISDEVYLDQAGDQMALNVSTNSDGAIVVIGKYSIPQYGYGLTLYRYDAGGVLLDSHEYPIEGPTSDCGVDLDTQIAAGPGADNLFSGGFYCTLHLDSFTFDGPQDAMGAADVFLAKAGPNWTVPWARQFTNADLLEPLRIATDAASNVFLAGRTLTSVDFGGGLVGPSVGDGSVVLAKADAGGGLLWTRSFVGGVQAQPRVATSNDGSVVLAESFTTNVVLGLTPIGAAGARDILIVRLAP